MGELFLLRKMFKFVKYMKKLSMVIRILLLLFVWLVWSGAIDYMMDQFINRDFPGFLQLVIIFLSLIGTAVLVNTSILLINKKTKQK